MNKKRVLVVGLGQLGAALVEELWDARVEIVAIADDERAVEALKDRTSAAFVGDASSPEVLEGVGAKNIDVAVLTEASDFEATALTVSTLVQMGVPSIIARAADERQAIVLRAIGATRVVLVEKEMGRRIAPEVLSPASSDLVEYASSFRVVPWVAYGAIVGKTVGEFNKRYVEINVLGYWRANMAGSGGRKPRPVLPSPDYHVQDGDTLLLIGLHDAVEKFLAEGWD